MLSERREDVLSNVIRSYIKTVQPISSKAIESHLKVRVSPATIRNEMSDLEDHGYITHPHTSAGRIPTDKGYRYFVDYLLPETMLSSQEQEQLQELVGVEPDSGDVFFERVTTAMSELTQEACVGRLQSCPEQLTIDALYITRIEDGTMLVSWVMQSGYVKTVMVPADPIVTSNFCIRLMHVFNDTYRRQTVDMVQTSLAAKMLEETGEVCHLYMTLQSLLGALLQDMQKETKVYRSGLRHILDKPEFIDREKTRRVFSVVEDDEQCREILHQGQVPHSADVQIVIGEENENEDLWDCSVMNSHWYVDGKYVGDISIVSPRRAFYARNKTLLLSMGSIVAKNMNNGRAK